MLRSIVIPTVFHPRLDILDPYPYPWSRTRTHTHIYGLVPIPVPVPMTLSHVVPVPVPIPVPMVSYPYPYPYPWSRTRTCTHTHGLVPIPVPVPTIRTHTTSLKITEISQPAIISRSKVLEMGLIAVAEDVHQMKESPKITDNKEFERNISTEYHDLFKGLVSLPGD